MAQKKATEKDNTPLHQFDELKKKHSDAILLFRQGDFYETYKQDAVKASVILAIQLADKVLPDKKGKIEVASFPRSALDTYLPKLIKAGERVALCDPLEIFQQKKADKERKKQSKETESITSNENDMSKKKEKVEAKASSKQEQKAEAKAESKAKAEVRAEEKSEEKQVRQPHDPQMITADGGKVTHGHAYQSKDNPEAWYFTAKIDGNPLKPQRMDAADLTAFQKKELTVPELMERYYPTKLLPKVPEEAFKFPKEMPGNDGTLTVHKFNVYKEKDGQSPDFGKYKFYAEIGDAKMSAVASRQDLNAYFDRVMTPNQLVERNFGERLHLKSAYEKYQLPDGVDAQGVRVAKDRNDNKWKVSVNMGDKGTTTKHEISFDDGYSLFKTKTATREQIAAKYLNTEIKGILANPVKMEKSASMKM